jgi:hypothetical protein
MLLAVLAEAVLDAPRGVQPRMVRGGEAYEKDIPAY